MPIEIWPFRGPAISQSQGRLRVSAVRARNRSGLRHALAPPRLRQGWGAPRARATAGKGAVEPGDGVGSAPRASNCKASALAVKPAQYAAASFRSQERARGEIPRCECFGLGTDQLEPRRFADLDTFAYAAKDFPQQPLVLPCQPSSSCRRQQFIKRLPAWYPIARRAVCTCASAAVTPWSASAARVSRTEGDSQQPRDFPTLWRCRPARRPRAPGPALISSWDRVGACNPSSAPARTAAVRSPQAPGCAVRRRPKFAPSFRSCVSCAKTGTVEGDAHQIVADTCMATS